MGAAGRLKKIRKKMKLTQEMFGKSVDLSQANIRDLESGKVKISTLHAFAFKHIYNINPEWLLKGEGHPYNVLTGGVVPPGFVPKEKAGKSPDIDYKNSTQAPLNIDLMRRVITEVEELFIERNIQLTPDKKAEVILLTYEMELIDDQEKKEVKKDNIIRLMKLAS